MRRIKRENPNRLKLTLKNEIIGIGLLFLSIFLIFSLFSYTPSDISLILSSSTSKRPIINYGGRIGCEVSAVLFNLFGYASVIVIFISFFFTIFFFINQNVKNVGTKGLGFILLLISASAFLSNIHPMGYLKGVEIKSGGIVGYFLNELFSSSLKTFFSLLLFIFLIIISLVLVAKISMRKVFFWQIQVLSRLYRVIMTILKYQAVKLQKKRQLKRIRQKHNLQTVSGVEKKMKKEEKIFRETMAHRGEKRRAVKKPSGVPEESFLFKELRSSRERAVYKPPPLSYLDAPKERSKIDIRELEEKKGELTRRLQEFKIGGEIVEYTPGPVITTFEFVPDTGVKVKEVSNLAEDLALVAKAQYVRIERILGKKAIGIEIPNKHREIIHLRELLESSQYNDSTSPLTLAIGKTKSGEIFVSDLREMPHLIIAGATGSGKSVTIHSVILSILYKSSPKVVKFILIDPKQIELTIYNSLPHLLTPVVVNPKLAKNALDWAVFEMENRYKKLASLQVRNIEQYNKKLDMLTQSESEELELLDDKENLFYIVIIIDEFANLMAIANREVEENIARLAQKARAVGIHLILSTQRPSIDVITGTIKNNFPSRIALAVPSKHDSRTIIDVMGAEKLLGNGDMLFLPPKTASLIRLHSAFVSEEEALRVVNYLAKIARPEFNTQVVKHISKKDEPIADKELDSLFFQAAEVVISTGQASASYLQRKMSIGYARAGRLIDQLQANGVVSAPNNKNQRKILMTIEDLDDLVKPSALEG